MGRSHLAVYRLTRGRLLGRVADMPVLLLTTTGRRSGKARTTPLTYFEAGTGSDLAVVASNGGEDRPPQWWLNLQDDSRAWITRGSRTEAVIARPATPEEHAHLWPVITAVNPGYAGYARRTQRSIPVVVLTRTKENAPNR